MGDTNPTFDTKECNKHKSEETLTCKITSGPSPDLQKDLPAQMYRESPRSPILRNMPLDVDEPVDINIESDDKEIQELHRVTTPLEPSSAISLKQAALDRPAAGAGGSSTGGLPQNRGRRHIRTSVFDQEYTGNDYGLPNGPAAGLGPQAGSTSSTNNGEIFSVRGTRSIKINRHRDMVNVFPSGCMGIIEDPVEDLSPTRPVEVLEKPSASSEYSKLIRSADSTPRYPESPDDSANNTPRPYEDTVILPPPSVKHADSFLNKIEEKVSENTSRQTVEIRPSSITGMQQRRPRPMSAVQRNPLTGVGYEDQDFIRQGTLKKRDGNPVLGQGYDNKDTKTKKIPPGGFSKGLW